jgi:hypothetical protein
MPRSGIFNREIKAAPSPLFPPPSLYPGIKDQPRYEWPRPRRMKLRKGEKPFKFYIHSHFRQSRPLHGKIAAT